MVVFKHCCKHNIDDWCYHRANLYFRFGFIKRKRCYAIDESSCTLLEYLDKPVIKVPIGTKGTE